MIWRERATLLIVLGIILLANTIFFFTYRVQYQSRLDALETRLEDAKAERDRVRNSRIRADRTVQSYQQVEKDVQQVFDEHWSTQPKRLTTLIGEVKHLAAASNLAPPGYAFDMNEVTSDSNARRRNELIGANEVGISFNVQGTYPQIRRLINLLELSRQFVIIDKVALSSADGDSLALTLHLKTLFRSESPIAGNKRL